MNLMCFVFEDVVARPHEIRKDTHGEFARISYVTRDSFPEGAFLCAVSLR